MGSLWPTRIIGVLEDEHDDGGNAVHDEGVGRALRVQGDGQERVAQGVHDAAVQVLGKRGQRQGHAVGQRLQQVLAQEGRQTLERLDQ